MTYLKLANFARSTLAGAIDNDDLALSVASGEGAKFPSSGSFMLAFGDTDEIVKCTARSTDTLTIERAQESTSAVSHSSGEAVALVITKGVLEEIQSAIDTKEASASVAADAVSAMGAKGNSNALNHDRYTDAEAVTAAKTVKLDDLTAPDDNADLDASTSKHGLAPKAVAPSSGVLNVLGIANGETVYTSKAVFDSTNPAAIGTAAPGTQVVAARRDHVHGGLNFGARAYLNQNQGSISGWVLADLSAHGTEVYDLAGEFASGKYTATTAGYYLIVASAYFQPGASKQVGAGIYIGGVQNACSMINGPQSAYTVIQCCCVVALAVNDYVQLYAYAGSTDTLLTSSSGTFLAVQRVL